jgi:hypothetical protein
MKVTINTKSAVTTVTVETTLTAKHFRGAKMVQLKDEKGNLVPFAFSVTPYVSGSSLTPATKAGITFTYSDKTKPLTTTYPVNGSVEDLADELGGFLANANRLEEQITTEYNAVKELASKITVIDK